MAPEVIYFIKVNIALIVFYAFYRLLFYKDTFFTLRRSTLLIFFSLGFLYPLFNMQKWITGQEPISGIIEIYSTLLPEVSLQDSVTHTSAWKEIFSLAIMSIYGLGVCVLTIRFFIRFGSILWLKIQSTPATIKGIKIYKLNNPAGPFSFFEWIFIHPESHSPDEMEEILTHELTHANQWHSVDVICSELVCILCWLNPFVWLLKREVRYNLEYLADNRVLESGYNSKSYQYHLLGLAHQQSGKSLYNNFNVFHLKNRIRMMNKERSHALGRTKYLLFIPLTIILMIISNIDTIARITPEFRFAPDMPPVIETEEIISTEEAEEDLAIFTVVEEMPNFPGGDEKLLKYINQHVKYPVAAQENGIQGRVVATFVVNKNGSISNPVVVRGIDPLLDNEAIRVISGMPKWNPGKQRGEPVSVKYTLPIVFRLSSN